MCGITGWIDWERDLSDEKQTLKTMSDQMYWRGPDAEGFWSDRHVAFAHRRLIVVDPQGGEQPMICRRGDETYTLVYNGELYNTEDVRKELKALGFTFKSWSDTEVLLKSYIAWGADCVKKLNGIFAFAIWDQKQQRLFLSRDRLGIKPLFYSYKGSSFWFASELKALLAHPEIEPILDREGLAEVFAIGPSRTPGHGVFRDIDELKPGHSLFVDQNGVRTFAYWKLESRPHEDDFSTTAEYVKQLLQDSIERQLVSDVPLCTLLSGGLDSSAISSFSARAYEREGKAPLHTYSVDFVDNDRYFKENRFQPNPDAPWVKRMADFLGTEHHDIRFDTPEQIESLEEAAAARDLPGMTDIDSSLLLFCREIKKQHTVALSGECADEVFGGYPWFHREDLLYADTFPWAKMVDVRLQYMADELKDNIRPRAYIQQRYQEALNEVPRLKGENGLDAKMREMFYLNLTRWMPTLLDRKDRMSMACGLEIRVPFCDHRLVEYMWNVPWSFKNHRQQAKGLLREALKEALPEDVRTRKKSPYPKTHNPSYLKASRERALEILNDPNAKCRDLFHRQNIKKLAEESKKRHIDLPWFSQLLNLPQLFAYVIQVESWLNRYRIRIG